MILIIDLKERDFFNTDLVFQRIIDLLRPIDLEITKVQVLSDKSELLPAKLKYLLSYLNEHYDEQISLVDAAHLAKTSKYHLCRVFKSRLGITFAKYKAVLRCCKAGEMLRSNNAISITKACYVVGFNDLSNFISSFKRLIGCSPSKFRNCTDSPQKCRLRNSSYIKQLNEKNGNIFIGLNFGLASLCSLRAEGDLKKIDDK